jgi:hypothetical protein
MNQSTEKRKKFIIKSNETDCNSVINSNIEYRKINNYNYNTFDNKGRHTIEIINPNNPIFKKITKFQINSINKKNKINPNNNYSSINKINKNKSKINVIEKQDSIHFNGVNENIKCYNGFSPSNKNNGNFRILANNNRYIINNIDKNLYGSPNIYINNDSPKDLKEKVNYKIRKASFKSAKLNSNKNRIRTEVNEATSKFELTDFNNNDNNNINYYIGNNLMYDNIYNLSNLHLNLNNKVLNKSLNYIKKERYTIDNNLSDKEDNNKRIINRRVEPLNMNSNGNIIYNNTMENEKSNISKNQINRKINYNYINNKNIRSIHKINTQNDLKILKNKDEIKKDKNYKKIKTNFREKV